MPGFCDWCKDVLHALLSLRWCAKISFSWLYPKVCNLDTIQLGASKGCPFCSRSLKYESSLWRNGFSTNPELSNPFRYTFYPQETPMAISCERYNKHHPTWHGCYQDVVDLNDSNSIPKLQVFYYS